MTGSVAKFPPHRTGLASKQRRGCVTSCGGRTRKEIAEEFGIGLSTLTRWLSRRQGAVMN
ncbi:helix-turn-helix domain-containing protein [Brucella sp. BTU2]|nr:helix-turn-helix domain-containing protein [Ochrobactrum sp. BTU2]